MSTTMLRRSLAAAFVLATCAAAPAAADGPNVIPERATDTAAPKQDLRSPDARATTVVVASPPVADLRSADARDGRRHVAPLPASFSQPVTVTDDDNPFSWLGAGIGAAVAALLAGGLVAVSRRRHHVGGPALHA